MTREVWLLIEEAESGSLAHGRPYCVLSAHATEAGAEAARDSWRREHGLDPDDGDDWCNCHGEGVTIDGPVGIETDLKGPRELEETARGRRPMTASEEGGPMTKSEQTRADAMADAGHACDACGGTGIMEYRPEASIRNGCVTVDRFFCTVCLGAGSFPDRMPAKDAVADAETVARFVFQAAGDPPRTPRSWLLRGREAGKLRSAVRAAFRDVPGLRGE